MKVELDRKGLEILVRGSEPYYDAFNHPLIIKGGHCYYDQYGTTRWERLKDLTDEELCEVYLICRNSWIECEIKFNQTL
jgi:hypothetical protein